MKITRRSPVQHLRRAWWRYHGERPVVTTFWPQDYPVGTPYQDGVHGYRVTHWTLSTDPRFYEVWGKPMPEGVTPGPQPSGPIIERWPDHMPRLRQRSLHS